MMKNILILTDSYPPEIRSAAQLMKDLADGLADKGHNIFVATTYPKYNLADLTAENKIFTEDTIEDGIRILRIKTLSHHKVNFIMRGLAQILIPYFFFRQIKKKIGKVDDVIVHSPPLPLAITAYKVKKFYGAKFILNLHDIFPQNAIDLGILKKWPHWPAIKLFERIEKSAYKNSDLIIVPSNEHKNFIIKKRLVLRDKVEVIYHWIDIEPFKKAQKTGRFRKLYKISEDKFVFLFGGVLGPSQGLDLLIRIAEKIENNKDIVFLFVGDGSAKESLVKMAAEKQLENVIFQPFVSAQDYPELVKDCNVGVISLTSQNTTPAVPAKILGYMAAAIPVVAFLHPESEALKIIQEAKCGYGAISNDEEKAKEIILTMCQERNRMKEFGENGLKYLLKNMEKKVCADKFEKLL